MWHDVRSTETGELLFRFQPDLLLIEVMRRRTPARKTEVVRLADYMIGAGLNFEHIEGIDIEAETE